MAEMVARAGYRVVLPYMPGYPPSGIEGPFDVDTLAHRIASLAAWLGDQVDVVGHDWGSAVAQVALMRFPERFRRAVTLSVPHPLSFLGNTLRSSAQLRRSRYMGFFQIPILAERSVQTREGLARLYRRWSPGPLPDAHLDDVLAALQRARGAPLGYYRDNLRPSGRLLRQLRFSARAQIATPTLYLHGAEDGCIAPSIADGQERFFSGPFASEILPGGHFLQLDCPAQLGGRITEWLGPPPNGTLHA